MQGAVSLAARFWLSVPELPGRRYSTTGKLGADARRHSLLGLAPWAILAPGILIAGTVLGFNNWDITPRQVAKLLQKNKNGHEGLGKSYAQAGECLEKIQRRHELAVHGLDLEVRHGGSSAFSGQTAGKTTTIKMIVGLLQQDQGVTVNGFDTAQPHRGQRSIGLCPITNLKSLPVLNT